MSATTLICPNCRFSLRCWYCSSFDLVSQTLPPADGYDHWVVLRCRDCGGLGEHRLRAAVCEEGPAIGAVPL